MKTARDHNAAAPEWETCCAQPHADEADMLRNHLEAAWSENTELRDRVSRMSTERLRWERDVRAAVKKAAWTHVLFAMKTYVWADAKRWVWDLANAFLQDAPSTRKDLQERLDRMRWQAMQVKTMYDDLDNPEGVPLVAELCRMRDAIQTVGERLHAEHGVNTGERCGCPGCELTRDIFDATLPDIAQGYEGN